MHIGPYSYMAIATYLKLHTYSIHTCIHMYIHNYYVATCVHSYVYIYTYIHTYIYTYTHTHIHTYTHTHKHTYTHTHIHTYREKFMIGYPSVDAENPTCSYFWILSHPTMLKFN